jgi:hypothetical protein
MASKKRTKKLIKAKKLEKTMPLLTVKGSVTHESGKYQVS